MHVWYWKDRTATAVLAAVLTSACAAATPPPRFSPVGPADADAPESSVPPPKPTLTGDGELAEATVPRAAEPETEYTCTMHPQVSSRTPGPCPICGLTLVEKPKPQEKQR